MQPSQPLADELWFVEHDECSGACYAGDQLLQPRLAGVALETSRYA
jgi:hypothetical protein